MYSFRSSPTPIDDRILKFGDTSLILTHPQEFMDRILAAMEDQDIHGHAELVSYVPDDYAGEVGPFRKLQQFAWQAEWRLATYAGPNGPRTLSIGRLHDIALVRATEQLNSLITTST